MANLLYRDTRNYTPIDVTKGIDQLTGEIVLADKEGNILFWTSAGSLGFKGAKKGTPFAASKAGTIVGEKAKALGIKDVNVVVKGVGSGREPTIRAFMALDIDITEIKDMTPVPHNGPKPKKPRRV